VIGRCAVGGKAVQQIGFFLSDGVGELSWLLTVRVECSLQRGDRALEYYLRDLGIWKRIGKLA